MSTRHISNEETLWEPRISFPIIISSDTSVDSWIYGGLKFLGVLVFASIETGPVEQPYSVLAGMEFLGSWRKCYNLVS